MSDIDINDVIKAGGEWVEIPRELTERERYIYKCIEEIKQAYDRQIQPYIKMLVDIQSLDPRPKHMFIPNPPKEKERQDD